MSDHSCLPVPVYKNGRGVGAGRWARLAANLPETHTECVPWPFSRHKSGYGQVMADGRWWRVHRYVMHVRGELLPAPMEVAHTCGLRACVNPHHLRMDTHAANMADRKTHDTEVNGQRNGSCKLTPEIVLAVRASTLMAKDIAPMLGVDPTTISNIRTRKTWAWL